jgi:hypothetical protein
MRRAAAELADTLAADPAAGRRAIRLAIAAMSWDGAGLDRLHRVARLADRPVLAWYAGSTVRQTLTSLSSRLPQAQLLAAARALAAAGTPAAAHLALAVTAGAGTEAGWPQPWRALVHQLRQHPDPDVQAAALDTVTSRE